MPANQRKIRTARPAGATKKETAGWWDSRAVPFLEKRAAILVVCLLLAGAGRIAATYHNLSITFDEPIHLVCGMEYLSEHVYRYETQHPPLERVMAALGPYLAGMRTTGRPSFTEEAVALLPPDPATDRTLTLMRLGVLPLFVVAGLSLYRGAARRLGKPAGILALAFFTMTPTVLAHAGLATTDIALVACLGGAFFALLSWAEAPNWRSAAILGLWTAVAVLSKFTTLAYLPVSAGFALLFYVFVRKPGVRDLASLARARWTTFTIAVAVGAAGIWAGYSFSFGQVPGWNISLPAPELFDGVRAVLAHNARGHQSYLLGKTSMMGWWYYFPVALAVKTPLPVLLLLIPGSIACWQQRRRSGLIPMALAAGILLPAMAGHINIGVRHVLPVYLAFSIIAALGFIRIVRWMGGSTAAIVIPAFLFVWLAWGGIRQHPDYLAYFNEFASSRPEDFLADSDLDWGQEMKRLARRLQESGAREVSLYVWFSESDDPDYVRKRYGFPPILPFDLVNPHEGWNVVSPTKAGISTAARRNDAATRREQGILEITNQPWFYSITPTERLGGLLLYHIPPGFRMQ